MLFKFRYLFALVALLGSLSGRAVEDQTELMDPDNIYPPGVKLKITYEADKDLFHLNDLDDPEAKRLYATPEDLAFALPSVSHTIADAKRRAELKGDREYTLEDGLFLFHPDDIPARKKEISAKK
jgi:hypothetical protein